MMWGTLFSLTGFGASSLLAHLCVKVNHHSCLRISCEATRRILYGCCVWSGVCNFSAWTAWGSFVRVGSRKRFQLPAALLGGPLFFFEAAFRFENKLAVA